MPSVTEASMYFQFLQITPKKVHAINEINPITKDMMANTNLSKERAAIAVVMKIKKINKYWEGFLLETP